MISLSFGDLQIAFGLSARSDGEPVIDLLPDPLRVHPRRSGISIPETVESGTSPCVARERVERDQFACDAHRSVVDLRVSNDEAFEMGDGSDEDPPRR